MHKANDLVSGGDEPQEAGDLKGFLRELLEATPRTFSTKHHIGNLALVPMRVKDGQWEPVQWSSARESDILKRYN